jgi:ABC-2 type transport system ATP-binding protein
LTPSLRPSDEWVTASAARALLHTNEESLSKGMRTKLALLLAFARRPDLMILDEPSDGLDPVGIEQMLESLVRHSAEGTTIFFSSH